MDGNTSTATNVTFSVVLHGMTPPWGANRHATWYDEKDRITNDAS